MPLPFHSSRLNNVNWVSIVVFHIFLSFSPIIRRKQITITFNMINLSHNRNLNFAFLFSYFLIYNLHATTSTLLPEQSPKYPQFTTPLASKTQRPSAISNLAPLTPDTLPAADTCALHQTLLFYFFFFFLFCNFQKIQCIFLSGLSTLFFVFFGFVWCFF